MKRFSVFLVLALAVLSVAALTACGCQASTQSDQNTSTSTPNNNTGTPGSSTTKPGTDSAVPDNGHSDSSSIIDEFTDDPAADAPGSSADSSTDNNALDLPTYEDMLRNGRVRDRDGFLNDDRR